MNKHRLYRRSKKIQGRGFFSDALQDKALSFLSDQLNKMGVSSALEGTARAFVVDKFNEILSKRKKHGAGLKFL